MKVKVVSPSAIPQSWYDSIIGLDIETEDKNLSAPICMVSLYKPKEEIVIVVPIKVYHSNSLAVISDSELGVFKKFLESVKVVGHNLQFDLASILYHWGVEVEPYFDTFLFARMMQFEQQGLKDIYVRLNPKMGNIIRKFENVMGTKPPFTYNIDDESVIKYSAFDAVMPFTIINSYKDSIKKLMTTIRIEMDYLRVAIRMKASGLRFDLAKFGELYKKYEDRVKQMQVELDTYAGEHVRITANADLAKLLIDTMGCTSNVLTGKGAISMNEESRAQMYDNCTDDSKRKIIKLVGDLKHEHSITNSTKKIPDFVVDGNLTFNVEQIGYDGTARVYCLTGDNKIELDGKLYTIEEVAAWRETGMIATLGGEALMTSCRESGVDDIYVVELEDGKKVRCNGDHPFAVERNGSIVWVKAKDLTEWDNVVIK